MNSAEIIHELGGPGEVAKLCKVSPQAVSQWFGVDPQTGVERNIPAARLMFLKVAKRAVFARLEGRAKAKDHAESKAPAVLTPEAPLEEKRAA